MIQDAVGAEEEVQYRKQLEGARQATQVEGVGQAGNQHTKKLAQNRLRETMISGTNDTGEL